MTVLFLAALENKCLAAASESLEQEKPLLLRKNMLSKTDGKNSKYRDTHTPNITRPPEKHSWTLSGWGDQEEWVSTSKPELPGPSCITLVGAGQVSFSQQQGPVISLYELGYKPQVTHCAFLFFLVTVCACCCFIRV